MDALLNQLLNLEPNKLTTDLKSYNFLVYAKPGLGKTTFATELFGEKSLILGAEFGYKGIPNAIGMPVADYPSLMNLANALDTNEAREKFDTIIVDTTTKIGEMIENFILSQFGKEKIGDCLPHGGAYPLINRYYNMVFNKLKARGYNFVYICHAGTEDIKNSKGEKIDEKYFPKMSDRINSLIEPEVDYTLFLTLNKDGERIIVTDRTNKNVGKRRTDLPLTMPLNADLFKEEFKKGIEKKSNGNTTDEKKNTTVVGFKKKSRDYKEIVKEIRELGRTLTDMDKGQDAVAIVNNRLGMDSNGIQRTLDVCTQENEEMLEMIVIDLKKLL